MSSNNINETKQKQRDAAEKAERTGLNREQRRKLKKAGITVKSNSTQKSIKKTENKIKHPVPYRANLDAKHDEPIVQEYRTRTEADKGWDQPPTKTVWKKPIPKPAE